MKTLRRCVVLCLLTTSGCGDPSCEEAVGAAMKRMGMGGERYGGERAQVISMCKDKKWSGKKRACFVEASNEEAVKKCSRMDHEPKKADEAAAPPPSDDRREPAPGTLAP